MRTVSADGCRISAGRRRPLRPGLADLRFRAALEPGLADLGKGKKCSKVLLVPACTGSKRVRDHDHNAFSCADDTGAYA